MTDTMQALIDFFGEPIHIYTRTQAIADGQLIDITARAAESGFTLPVAITAAAWAEAVAWTQEDGMQDEEGRLSDVVNMSAMALRIHSRKGHDSTGSGIPVLLYRVPNTAGADEAEETTLYVAISGGDNAEPVGTIMTARDL